ncbi:MAG TPA: kelch repeat-containing protein [Thermoanaerobaculia bacterium]|nr:kelch repeat-containing protein [Thermoanaerobaculia bacterium]
MRLAVAAFLLLLTQPLFGATWAPLAPVITPRQEVAVTEANGKIYLIGGIGDGLVLSSVEEYDPLTNRWRFVAPLPEPLHHSAAATVDGVIYLVGGYRTLSFIATDSVYRYEPLLDRWTKVASLPAPRGALAAAALNGRVYAVGGVPGLTSFTMYDPAADTWTTLPSMPTGREHLAVAAAAGRIYAISGRRGGNLAAVEEFDPAMNRWQAVAPIPTARSGIAAANVGSRIYVFGGEGNPNRSDGVFPQVESFDAITGAWRTEPMMPTPRHGIAAAAINGTIYVPAGATVQGFGTSAVHDALFTSEPLRRRAVRR